MRKALKQILWCAAGLVVFCVLCRYVFFNRFSIWIPVSNIPEAADGQQNVTVALDGPAVKLEDISMREGGYAQLSLMPQEKGETDIQINPDTDNPSSLHPVRVGRFNTVYDLSTGNFTGDAAVLIGFTLFWLLVSAIMVWHFFQAKGVLFYDYGTIYYAGFSLFALATGLAMLNVTLSRLIHPESFTMMAAYSAINSASIRYMQLTAPLMLLFSGAMAVSNIVLLRHERPRLQNGLGLLVSALLVIGEGVGAYMFTRDFSGSELEGQIRNTILNTYATIFVYFQCMLTGSVICGITAARHNPDPDKDFIIILGCWFRKDGSLPPLIRSRVDRALSFWTMQKETAGKEAFFIPSGGQGKNESMPEAEAMRRYLVSKGIEDRAILPEDQSLNTFQNMSFSGRIIRDTIPEGKAVFATSNYHVFRSGLWARQTGLAAEGIGSKTKWWFWPNAFMRETAGLFQKRWKQEILFLLLLVVFFGFLSMILW